MIEGASARDCLLRLGGALHSRRIFGEHHANWPRTVEALEQTLRGLQGEEALTLGLVERGLVLGGVLIPEDDPMLTRLATALRQRDVEILTFGKTLRRADVEGALAFLAADPADVAGESGTGWLQARGLEGVTIRHLQLAMSQSTRAQGFRDVYRAGSETVGSAFQSAAAGKPPDLLSLRELCRSLLGVLQSDELPVQTLVALREKDGYTFAHSINVSILAACQATALDLGPEVAEQVALCGLLHDLGKARLPDAILKKRGALDEAERALLATHPAVGARMLFAAQGAGHAAPLVALEHHGPHNPSRRAHLFSQLVGIADAYDVLRSARPFDPKTGNPGLYWFLESQLRGRFHPALLGRFGRLLGVQPTGSLAHLESGEVCRVVDESAEDPLRPKVEIVDSALGVLPAGQQVDLSEGPRRLLLSPHPALRDLTVREFDDFG